jgi:hypothetical protein
MIVATPVTFNSIMIPSTPRPAILESLTTQANDLLRPGLQVHASSDFTCQLCHQMTALSYGQALDTVTGNILIRDLQGPGLSVTQ